MTAALAAFFMPAARAQDSLRSPMRKGVFTIGAQIGTAGMSRVNQYQPNQGAQYYVSLTPSAGYFFTDRWMLSGSVLAGFGGVTKRNVYAAQSLGIGLAARYYVGKAETEKGVTNRLRVYAEAGASLQTGWSRISPNDSVTERSTGSRLNLRAGAGINYLITSKVAFESGIIYNRSLAGSDNFRSMGFIDLELGFRVFLNRR
jgi:hypothetical protein